MEAARSSETLVSNHHAMRRISPENNECYVHRRENLSSRNFLIL